MKDEYEQIMRENNNLDFESYGDVHIEFSRYSEGNFGFDAYNAFKAIRDEVEYRREVCWTT